MKLNKKIIIIISLVVLALGGSTVIGINILNNKKTPTKEVPDKNKEELDKNENLEENENNNNETLEVPQEEVPEENNTEKPVDESTQNKVDTNKESSKNTTSSNAKPTTNKTETNKEASNKTETAKKEETKTVIKTEKVTEEINRVDNKYTTNYTEVSYEVKTYSDKTTEKKEIGRKDKIIFNAKTTDMLEEAKQVASANKSIYEEVVKYTNDVRAKVNGAPLTLDDKLSEAATVRAIEMAYANKFSHARPNSDDKNSCFTVLSDLGITYFSVGENIAYGYPDSKTVTDGWENSPGHYANMVRESYGKIGIGMYKLNGTIYWVQIFTN